MPTQAQPHLQLVPVGTVDDLAMTVVAAHLQALMGLDTAIAMRQAAPENAYQRGRHQYDAWKIVQTLSGGHAGPALVLGVTALDICTPILTFVFGESQLGGNTALVSLCRITAENRDLTYTRAAKIALHEVGHLLGIGHCRRPACLMTFTATIARLDDLNLWFCDACDVEVSRRRRQRFAGFP